MSVGVAGLRFGMSWAQVFAAYSETDLLAVCDVGAKRRDLARAQLEPDAIYDSLEALIADDRLDAVAIFTPAPLHAQQVIAAIQAGKHVLSAVPAAMTLDEAKQLAEVVSSSDRTYMMAENWVHEPVVARAVQLYREGTLGQVYYAEAEYYHGLQQLRRRQDGRPTWRNSLQPLLYPTHGTAPYLHMTGDRLAEVMASGASGRSDRADGYQADWIQTAMFRGEQGALFRLSNSFQNVHAASHLLIFHGDEGSLETGRFDQARTVCYYSSGDEEDVRREVCEHPELPQFGGELAGDHGRTSMQIVMAFVQTAATGSEPPVDIMLALDMTLPGIVGLQSIRSGNWEQVPDPRSWT